MHTRTTYLQRWRDLNRDAWLYLAHAALLTGSLAVSGLFFNLAILALGYPREFLGWLNTVSIAVAALLSLPLWWLVTRLGLRWGLFANAILQATSAFTMALWPVAAPLLAAVALTGIAAVLFQVSSPPFMMQHSDDTSRDHLFSANTAINIGVAGISSLLAGGLPRLLGGWLGVPAESALAYRAAFAVAGCGLALSLVPLVLIQKSGGRSQRSGVRSQESGVRSQESGVRSQESGVRSQDDGGEEEDGVVQPSGGFARWLANSALIARLPDPYRGWLLRPGPLLRLLIPPFLISWGAALLIPYLNLFFKETFAVTDSTLGAIFAALGITTGLAALAAPVLSVRIGKIATVALTQALSLPFLLLLGFVPVLGVAVAAALARGALFNMGIPLYDAFAMERTAPRDRPLVIGLINGAYTAGYLVAPLISTRVQARYGFAPLFLATATCYALAALTNYRFFVRGAAARAAGQRS